MGCFLGLAVAIMVAAILIRHSTRYLWQQTKISNFEFKRFKEITWTNYKTLVSIKIQAIPEYIMYLFMLSEVGPKRPKLNSREVDNLFHRKKSMHFHFLLLKF